MRKKPLVIAAAFGFTAAILVLGYLAFGLLIMLIFTSGFLGGFFVWLFVKSQGEWPAIKTPFWLTFVLFLVHRVEEKLSGFFGRLSEITGVPTPAIDSIEVISLVALSVLAWLAIPMLLRRRLQFGYYLAWTFFCAMGVTELAHFFVFPFLVGKLDYFPGMASVIFLAPTAWWGIIHLGRRTKHRLTA